MSRRKKNGDIPQDDRRPDIQGGEVDLAGLDISQLTESELEALTAPGPLIAEPPDAAAGGEMEALDIPEPEMDDLLAELLAHEPPVEMEAAPEAEPQRSIEAPVELDCALEPALEAVPEPEFVALADLDVPDEVLAAPIPEPDLPVSIAVDAEPLLPETQPSLPEPVALEAVDESVEAVELAPDEPAGPVLEAAVEASVEAAAPVPPAELETPAEPPPPQPALETVVRSIDQALEAAPAVASLAEPAAPAHHHKQFSQLDDYVVFALSGTDYAVPVRDVAEIGRIPSITRLPNVPDFIRGITNLRGEVVPVLSLPVLLGLQDAPATARGRVLFLQPRERVSSTGLVVDEVKGIQRIQSQQLEQVTGLVDDKVTSVLRGVHGRGDRLLNVLDLEQLFHLQEFQQLESR
jgi:purine-binding chemotaxis protein CheW